VRIGLDFDNTIAGYDHVFPAAAEREGLIAKGAADSKAAVKSHMHGLPGGHEAWMRLQGRVYGAFMHQAKLIEGVEAFLIRCRDAGADVFIVSHKTEFGHFDPDKINLRGAALEWMRNQGFFAPDKFGLSESAVFFEPTRAQKVAKIAALDCAHFIDDLEEVFREPSFPTSTRRHLFATVLKDSPDKSIQTHADWISISNAVFEPHD
jgi:hypothetical protein